VASCALLVGCTTDDGRDLRAPAPGQTAPTTTASTAVQATELLTLSSPAFAEGQSIPARFTCDGTDASPPLDWNGAPAAAAELAIVVRDPDAGGFVHWVIAGLAPELTGIAEDAVPEGAVEGQNGFGRTGWAGPCPPAGSHTYEFTLHVLSEPLGMQPDLPAAAATQLVESASIETARLRGTYER
jgi:Raf kinase inhibitor-like YbhB/YbcL family protein